jgi:pilus assembly protein CpaB
MRNRIFAVLALAVLAGGGLAYGTFNAINTQPVKSVAAPTDPVVVSAADLPLGTELKKDDLTVINFPKGATPEGAFATKEQVIGRGLIVSTVKNEPILDGKLASKEAGSGLPPVITPGMRAISVRVNEVIGVAGYVLPGSRVDVLATASPTSQPQDATSKVILSNVQVLTAGTRLEQTDKGKPMQVTVVTLLVFPEQSERLALASTEGKIQLALRNPLDQGAPETPGMKQAVLLGLTTAKPVRTAVAMGPRKPGTGPVTQASPAAAPTPTVEMIRGDKRTAEVIK